LPTARSTIERMPRSARKGDCFEAAYGYLRELHEDGEAGIALCHGVVTSRNGTFIHAWVEKTNGRRAYAFDVTNTNFLPLARTDYYRILSIRKVQRYTRKRALIEFVRHGHFGPWHPTFDRKPARSG